MNEKTCQWKYVWDGDYDYYSTSCGRGFVMDEGSPEENDYNYCPGCGGKIIEKENQNESNR